MQNSKNWNMYSFSNILNIKLSERIQNIISSTFDRFLQYFDQFNRFHIFKLPFTQILNLNEHSFL